MALTAATSGLPVSPQPSPRWHHIPEVSPASEVTQEAEKVAAEPLNNENENLKKIIEKETEFLEAKGHEEEKSHVEEVVEAEQVDEDGDAMMTDAPITEGPKNELALRKFPAIHDKLVSIYKGRNKKNIDLYNDKRGTPTFFLLSFFLFLCFTYFRL